MEVENDLFMEEAFKMAKEALNAGEVPVGCIFVYNEKMIGRGRNTVNETRNATRHAEINAIDQIVEYSKSNNLTVEQIMAETVLYVNVEPCGMCADAVSKLGLRKIIFGCCNDRFGGCGSVMDIFKLKNYPIEIVKGVRDSDAIALLKEFYKGENPNAPSGKAKRKTKVEKPI